MCRHSRGPGPLQDIRGKLGGQLAAPPHPEKAAFLKGSWLMNPEYLAPILGKMDLSLWRWGQNLNCSRFRRDCRLRVESLAGPRPFLPQQTQVSVRIAAAKDTVHGEVGGIDVVQVFSSSGWASLGCEALWMPQPEGCMWLVAPLAGASQAGRGTLWWVESVQASVSGSHCHLWLCRLA